MADEKSQLKKKCKEEKKRLDEDLEKMKQRKIDLEKEEHAQVLRQIDQEFEEEHNKLLEKRKLVAEQNRSINVV